MLHCHMLIIAGQWQHELMLYSIFRLNSDDLNPLEQCSNQTSNCGSFATAISHRGMQPYQQCWNPFIVKNTSSIKTKSAEKAIQLSSYQDGTILTTVCMAQGLIPFSLATFFKQVFSQRATIHCWMQKAVCDGLIAVGKHSN